MASCPKSPAAPPAWNLAHGRSAWRSTDGNESPWSPVQGRCRGSILPKCRPGRGSTLETLAMGEHIVQAAWIASGRKSREGAFAFDGTIKFGGKVRGRSPRLAVFPARPRSVCETARGMGSTWNLPMPLPLMRCVFSRVWRSRGSHPADKPCARCPVYVTIPNGDSVEFFWASREECSMLDGSRCAGQIGPGGTFAASWEVSTHAGTFPE